MLASKRWFYILQKLEEADSVTMKQICQDLNVSESTVRRDLEELEQQNKLKRVHGGAIRVSMNNILNDSTELTMIEKIELNSDCKRSLAKCCASLVQDGDCIFVDGGTTFHAIVSYLEGKRIKVVTHSDLVRTKPTSTLELFVIGGRYLQNYQMNVGPLALETLSKFSFDKVFIGCAGIDEEMNRVFTAEMDSAQIKQLAMSKSNVSYLVVDKSKINTTGFYNFAITDDFTKVISDVSISDEKYCANIMSVNE